MSADAMGAETVVTQIRMCGFGGQGIVLAGVILGHAGVLDGKYVAQSSSYGAEARGSACKSEVVISDEWIDYPHVLKPDVLLAMSQAAYEKYASDVAPQGGSISYDGELVRPDPGVAVPHFPVPATQRAVGDFHNRMVANTVLLGAMAQVTGVVTQNSLMGAIEMNVNETFLELNTRAAELGFGLGTELKRH